MVLHFESESLSFGLRSCGVSESEVSRGTKRFFIDFRSFNRDDDARGAAGGGRRRGGFGKRLRVGWMVDSDGGRWSFVNFGRSFRG